MKYVLDRIIRKRDTIKNPLYQNPYSAGKLLLDNNKCNNCGSCIDACITNAIKLNDGKAEIDHKSCIFCHKCIAACSFGAISSSNDYRMAEFNKSGNELRKKIYKSFNKSLTLRSVDTGSCNACMLELSASQNTYYDLSRYGISFAASPRHADGIVVTGPVAINMKEALEKTYYAMAEPRLVIAAGTCAYDGGIFKQSYGNYADLGSIIPVDIVVPGCPPSPQAIIYGLLKLLDRI